MTVIHSSKFKSEGGGSICKDSGFFTWDIATNRLHADGAIAEMFGLNAEDAESGLPLEAYMARVHPDDRPAVAITIRDTIISTEPEYQSYRTKRADGTYVTVMVFGRCFRDRNGIPSVYAGIIFPAAAETAMTTQLLHYCLAAYEIALREGKAIIAEQLLAALREQGWQDADRSR